MYLGSVYLIVNDFEKTLSFYEKLLEIPVTSQNMTRFATFNYHGKNISIMNGHFDTEHPDKVIQRGEHTGNFDDLRSIALAPNMHKFVLNFCTGNLRAEHERIAKLGITKNMSKIKYVCNVNPYYFFHLTDPDDNMIEITGDYSPAADEFKEG